MGKHTTQPQTIIHIFLFMKQQYVSSVTHQINCQQEDVLKTLNSWLKWLNTAFSSCSKNKADKYTHRHKSLSSPATNFESCSSCSFLSASQNAWHINLGCFLFKHISSYFLPLPILCEEILLLLAYVVANLNSAKSFIHSNLTVKSLDTPVSFKTRFAIF